MAQMKIRWQVFAAALFFSLNPDCPVFSDTAQPQNETERYSIEFHYSVKNKTSKPVNDVVVSIPLPADDAGQRISDLHLNLNGEAATNTTDQFGQPIVQVTIATMGPHEKREVGFACNVEVKPFKVLLDRTKCGSLEEIPAEIRKAYTGDLPDTYALSSPIIQSAANKFASDYPNLVDRLQAMHDFVAGTIRYKLSGHWAPAPVILTRKTGSCSEYSTLFASLCRANGLPTRTVGSSHLRTTTDFPYKDSVWHRWLEVYLPPYGWVPFDVTLDEGKPPLQKCYGSYDFRTLRVSRGGFESNILGTAYVGANNHEDKLKREKYYVWTKGL